ncbi:hypothetical protein Tco_0710249 [Tanacetum coccineum]
MKPGSSIECSRVVYPQRGWTGESIQSEDWSLNERNDLRVLDGTCTKASYITNVVLSNQWERCNVVVLSWLLSSISDDLYLSQVYSKYAAEVWKELKETYDKLDGEFDILTKLSPCTCDAKTELSKHNQLMKLMQFLMGLDDVYLPIRSSLLTQTELPDVKDAFVIVCREESHRGLGSELNITVGYPNGTTAKIRKVGNLKLTSNIVLFDVLVIPEYRDLKRENVLRTGEAGGLYVFNTKYKTPNFKSNNSFLCFNVSKGIWHNKLGHPSDQVISVLKNILSIGKPTHSMPWGPYKVTTRDGFRYFLTMVDDYYRAV